MPEQRTQTRGTRTMGSHHRPNCGKTVEYFSPPEIVNRLGPFDLDPCSAMNRPWPTAARHYHEHGLEKPWSDCVWLNPPYGHPQQWPWVKRLSEHGNGIALIFARTETKGFHEYCWQAASAMLFLRGRLYFHRSDGTRLDANAGAPSVLVAYGWLCSLRLNRCKLPGHFVPLAPWAGKVPRSRPKIPLLLHETAARLVPERYYAASSECPLSERGAT